MSRIKRKSKKCGKKITKEEVNVKPSVLPVTRLPTYGDMVATDIKFVWSVLFPGVPTISGQ